MLDRRTLNQWLRIGDAARAGAADLYMAGSRARDENPALTEHLNAVAQTLGTAARMMDKVILAAGATSANSPTITVNESELVGEKGAK